MPTAPCRLRALVLVLVLVVSSGTAAVAVEPADAAWTQSPLYGGTVSALATSPDAPSEVLAGTAGAGAFRSRDGGATWTRSSSGLPPDTAVVDIAYARSARALVYAATSAGVFRSTDAGSSWAKASDGIDTVAVISVAVDPLTSTTVFAASPGTAWRSTDGAQTWTELTDRHGQQLSTDVVAVAPADPDVVYALGATSFRSDDGGSTWDELAAPPHVSSVSVDEQDPRTLLVGSQEGVSRSDDGGATWEQVHAVAAADDVITLHRDPASPDVVWAGTSASGLVRSDDGGFTWSEDAGGLPPNQRVLAVAVTDTGVLAGLAHSGAFHRERTASGWSPSSTGITGSQVTALAAAPQGDGTVYAGTWREGVFRSADGGASWSSAGLAGRIVYGLAVSPVSAATLWAATEAGVQRSDDGGSTWVRQLSVPFQDATDVVVSPSVPDTLYATTFEGGVHRSDDGGATWRALGLRPEAVVFTVEVHPQDPGTLWVGTRTAGVAWSTDGGDTWKESFDALFYDVVAIAVDPRAPDTVYAAVTASGAGISRSTDGGATWTTGSGGTPPPNASAVAVDPSTPGRVYAAGSGDTRPGVFVSDDDGRTWRPLDAGLTTRAAESLAVEPDGTVHAGTAGPGYESGGGAFRLGAAGGGKPPRPAPQVRSVDDACPLDRVPEHPFTDVPPSSTHERAISCVVWWEVANGRTPTAFVPTGGVNREAMASFVARAVLAARPGSLPEDPSNAFSDDEGSVHELAIDQLASVGIISGTGDGRFSPTPVVTRGQMARFLARAAEHVLGQPLPAGDDAFSDDDGSTFEQDIDRVAAAGITGGAPDGGYLPGSDVLRQQMASFLARTLDLLVDEGAASPPSG